jgi:RsiW-degrading membrane proteinase PrsW (M82 family)
MVILLVDAAAVAAWILVLRKLDKYGGHKNSGQTLFAFYIAGIGSALLVMFLYPVLDLFVLPGTTPAGMFAYDLFAAGPLEEMCKFLAFFFFSLMLRSIREPADGMLQAASAALGFASMENIFYACDFGLPNLLIRSALCIAGHMVYSSICGLCFALLVLYRPGASGFLRFATVPAAVFAAGMVHGIYNFFLEIHATAAAIALDILLLFWSFLLLRLLLSLSPFRPFTLAEHQEAVSMLKSGLAADSGSFVLNQRLAGFYFYRRQYDRALPHLNRCLQASYGSAYFKCLKGAALMLGEDPRRGQRLLREGWRRLGAGRRQILLRNFAKLTGGREDLQALLRRDTGSWGSKAEALLADLYLEAPPAAKPHQG